MESNKKKTTIVKKTKKIPESIDNKNILENENVFMKQVSQKNTSKGISVTDDKMINEVLENIGKKSKNPVKKTIIDNFISEKNKNTNTNSNSNIKQKNNNIDNSEKEINEETKKKTFTENLSKDDINKKLEDYKLVDDMSTVPLDTHLRYFIKKNGEMLFRMGGNLKRNLDLPNYIVLKNAQGIEWTVQIKDTIFYKKMSIKEIKEEYENIISELHDKIKKLKNKIKELEK